MKEYDYLIVGQTIKDIRTKKGLTQEVLSDFACISRSHLSMIETGSKHPNLGTIWKIAQALELEPHELVKKIEDNTK